MIYLRFNFILILMLRSFFLIILLGSLTHKKAFAQSTPSTPTDTTEKHLKAIEEMPEYPGGTEALYRFIIENLQYPSRSNKKGIQGTIYLSFIVELNGEITSIRIVKSVEGGAELEQEAIRVIGLMPRWKAGTVDGKPARAQFTLPIKYVLTENHAGRRKRSGN